jgi:hypothetical protein
MRLLLPLSFLLAAGIAATALAQPVNGALPPGACVVSEVSPLDAGQGGQVLYRITFQNYCGTPRSFFWCAEHPARPVPPAVACTEARGAGSEVRQLIRVRREYQWHLPAGARVRHLDCSPQEAPTPEFRCEPVTAVPQRR